MFSNAAVPFSESPNLVAPRLAFDILSRRPGTLLKNAKSPLLVVAPDNDDMIPLYVTKQIVSSSDGSKYNSGCISDWH